MVLSLESSDSDSDPEYSYLYFDSDTDITNVDISSTLGINSLCEANLYHVTSSDPILEHAKSDCAITGACTAVKSAGMVISAAECSEAILSSTAANIIVHQCTNKSTTAGFPQTMLSSNIETVPAPEPVSVPAVPVSELVSVPLSELVSVPVVPASEPVSVSVSSPVSVVHADLNTCSFQETEKEQDVQASVGIINSEEHVYKETVPNPIAEENPAWNQLLETIAGNKKVKKSKTRKDNIPPMTLKRSVRFADKGAPSS